MRFCPLIIKEQDAASLKIMILWITDDYGPFDFAKVSTNGEVRVFTDSGSRYSGFWQLLSEMSPGSSMTGRNQRYEVTVTWDGKDLNIIKKSL